MGNKSGDTQSHNHGSTQGLIQGPAGMIAGIRCPNPMCIQLVYVVKPRAERDNPGHLRSGLPRDQQALLQADIVSARSMAGCRLARRSAVEGIRCTAATFARSPTSAKALCRTSADRSCTTDAQSAQRVPAQLCHVNIYLCQREIKESTAAYSALSIMPQHHQTEIAA